MEEDIKILEEYKDNYLNIHEADMEGIELGHAIENLIKRYKELEEENKKYPIKLNDETYRRVIDNAQKDYIAKSVIREKIEELIKEADYRTEDNPKGRIHFSLEPCDYQIQVLQEILEG